MIWLYIWLAGHVIIPPLLYIGYGFVMCAQFVAPLKDGEPEDRPRSPPHVYKVDFVLAMGITLLDGLYNAFWLPALCVDPRPHYAFRLVTVKGVTFPFFELVTERFSRYNEQPKARGWHKLIARIVAPFLNAKDLRKGWHIRKSQQGQT